MIITDAQIEAAMRAYANALAYNEGGFRDKMRAALEAAAQAAPAPDALPRWYNLVCARCGGDIRRRDEAAPAPTTGLEEYERLSKRLKYDQLVIWLTHSNATPLMREAAAAIRKLTEAKS